VKNYEVQLSITDMITDRDITTQPSQNAVVLRWLAHEELIRL